MELDQLQGRVSQSAWKFFRYGRDEEGLHDGRLLSLTIGDGLNYVADGAVPFLLNRQLATASVAFLNYDQTYHYIFEMRGLRACDLKYRGTPTHKGMQFGDLFLYELSAADNDHLQLGFLFADESEITLTFRKLLFRRERLRPSYERGDWYA